MIRRIRELLYDQGFTISGARNKLQELAQGDRDRGHERGAELPDDEALVLLDGDEVDGAEVVVRAHVPVPTAVTVKTAPEGESRLPAMALSSMRRELMEIRELLSHPF